MIETIQKTIYDNLGASFDPNILYFFTIQGPSCSGKSKYSNALVNTLKKVGRLAQLIHLDGFYNFIADSKVEEKNFDYDNSATINWEGAHKIVEDMIEKKYTITKYRRTTELVNVPIIVTNENHNIAIFEGIYAGNVLGKRKFNLNKFDPENSNKRIDTPFVDNPIRQLVDNYNKSANTANKKWKAIKMLNIRFSNCVVRMKAIRVERDVEAYNETVESVTSRIYKWIVPATKNWVFADEFVFDFEVKHGNFNQKDLKIFNNELFKWFGIEGSETEFVTFKDSREKDFSKVKTLKCDGSCQKGKNVTCYLEDIILSTEN